MNCLAYILGVTWLIGAALVVYTLSQAPAHAKPIAGAGLLLMVGAMVTGLVIQWRRGRD